MLGNNFSKYKPIFIIGVPRSGTTLLQMLLNSHRNIAIYSEIHFFSQILQIKRFINKLNKDNLDQFIEYVKKTNHYKYLPNIDTLLPHIKEKMERTENLSYEHFYLFLMQEFAESENKIRFGEKTPQNINYIDELINLFPKAKIIHIVRDPRAVVSSLIKVKWSANDVLINTLKWKVQILNFEESEKKWHNNCLLLRYEDLLSQTEKYLRKVCEFIDEKYDENMLEYHFFADRYLQNEKDKLEVKKNINLQAINKWKNNLSLSEIYTIEKILGSYLTKYNYPKCDTNLFDKIKLPYIISKSIHSYYKYLNNYRKYQKSNKDIIQGDNSKFKRMAIKALLKR